MYSMIGIGLFIGMIAGFLSGLLGIGGGIVMVPMLLAVFTAVGENSATIMQHAVWVTLMGMTIITFAGTYAHHRRGAVHWAVWRRLIPGLIIGGMLGAFLSRQVPSTQLQQLFALFLFWVAWQLWQRPSLSSSPSSTTSLTEPTGSFVEWLIAGIGVGTLSGLLGIGGGVVLVPLFLARGLSMVVAAGTSVAGALPIALSASVMNTLMGSVAHKAVNWMLTDGLLAGAIGIGGLLTVSKGAACAHRWPSKIVQRIFVGVLLLLAFKLLLF